MTLKEFKDVIKDIPDNISDKIILSIGIKDEKDITENNGVISIPEFSERYDVNNVSMIAEGTMAPKMFLTYIRKNKK
jgi:hypothetical protein